MKAIFEPRLTVHAIERYQRRIENVSPSVIRERLMTERVKALLSIGTARIDVDGARLIARSGAIVSVYPPGWATDRYQISKAKGRRSADREKKVRKIQAGLKAIRNR